MAGRTERPRFRPGRLPGRSARRNRPRRPPSPTPGISAGRSASCDSTYSLGRPRVTYWLAPGRRVILLTVFRKTRSAETAEVSRALQAQKVCEAEHRPAHVTFDREVP